MPSLPPVSCTTTRMVSLAPALSALGAARAVRWIKPGVLNPRATRLLDFKKLRREENMRFPRKAFMGRASAGALRHPGRALLKLKFRQGQHQVTNGADALVGRVLRRPVYGHAA